MESYFHWRMEETHKIPITLVLGSNGWVLVTFWFEHLCFIEQCTLFVLFWNMLYCSAILTSIKLLQRIGFPSFYSIFCFHFLSSFSSLGQTNYIYIRNIFIVRKSGINWPSRVYVHSSTHLEYAYGSN